MHNKVNQTNQTNNHEKHHELEDLKIKSEDTIKTIHKESLESKNFRIKPCQPGSIIINDKKINNTTPSSIEVKKLIKCKYCTHYGFKSRSGMYSHMKVVHGQTKKKHTVIFPTVNANNFECQKCEVYAQEAKALKDKILALNAELYNLKGGENNMHIELVQGVNEILFLNNEVLKREGVKKFEEKKLKIKTLHKYNRFYKKIFDKIEKKQSINYY